MLFNSLLGLATKGVKNLWVDEELEKKLRYYSFQKKLQFMEELWKQDFRREAEIFLLKYKESSKKAVQDILEKMAQEQTPPSSQEGRELFGWIDAAGNWHEK